MIVGRIERKSKNLFYLRISICYISLREIKSQLPCLKLIHWIGNSCKVIGRSNIQHQIDVLTIHSDGIHSYGTAIECKYWNKKIDKDIVMKLSSINMCSRKLCFIITFLYSLV